MISLRMLFSTRQKPTLASLNELSFQAAGGDFPIGHCRAPLSQFFTNENEHGDAVIEILMDELREYTGIDDTEEFDYMYEVNEGCVIVPQVYVDAIEALSTSRGIEFSSQPRLKLNADL